MIPMKELRLKLGTLLAADSATLAPAADANEIALIKAAFNEDEDLVIGDLTLADFDGSTPIAGALGTQQTGIDPDTAEQRITIKDPLGGYRFITTGLTNLPQQIFGMALTNLAGTALLGVELFDEPITLTEVGQEINLGKVQMTMVLQPLS